MGGGTAHDLHKALQMVVVSSPELLVPPANKASHPKCPPAVQHHNQCPDGDHHPAQNTQPKSEDKGRLGCWMDETIRNKVQNILHLKLAARLQEMLWGPCPSSPIAHALPSDARACSGNRARL